MKAYLLASVCFATVTIAQQEVQLIDLVADKGSYDQQKGIAVYEGNVKVTQGVATFWADQLTIYLKNNTAERIEAKGQPVKFHYQGEKQPIDGEGQTVSYEILPKIVTLSGQAIVKQGQDTIEGNTLTYDLNKETIGGTRVRMTFLPVK